MKKIALVLFFVTCVALAGAQDRGRLSGRAYLGRGDYVVGASVLVRPQEDGSRLYLTATDDRGQFRAVGLADGAYLVDVERVGLLDAVKNGVEVRHPFRAVVDLPMQRGRIAQRSGGDGGGAERALSLRVRVGEAAQPVGEVRVRLVRPDGGADPQERLTASDGSAEIDGIPAGLWRLEAGAVGYLPLRKHVELARDAELQIALVRQPADYEPSALELMPLEEPLVPAALEERTGERTAK